MNADQENYQFVSQLDAFEIERQARAMQARAMADMVKSLLRSISARLHRNAAAHTA
ncbi:MAG: hypothetical protein H6898_02270 [Rhodobacter sp.]|nr:hypothetical protein [Paracoccaceae bacterium]MCC0075397.1 hypothetical protein [Rhodobacter sp.]